jgi:hypothetical protein
MTTDIGQTPEMLKKLDANTAETRAWTEALTRIADPSSPAAVAIEKHLDTLADNHARILGLSEEKIDEEASAAVERQIQEECTATWRALEDSASPHELEEIKRLIGKE